MTLVTQRTLARSVEFSGVGLHSGRRVEVRVNPAKVDSGVVFRRLDLPDGDNLVPARAQAVCDTRLGTVVANAGGVKVATVEHLMAALFALGLDNAVVELDGPEVPIMDGSALSFVRAFDRAGRRPQHAPRRYIEVSSAIAVEDGRKRAALIPASEFEVGFEIEFDSAAIGRQHLDLVVDEAVFRDLLADCRTFGFLRDVEQLRAAGLAHGGSLDNAIIIDEGRVLNHGGLRRPNEFVGHKAVDAIGDLALLGAPLLARYEGRYAGHALNNLLARALLAQPSAWRYVYRDQVMAAAS